MLSGRRTVDGELKRRVFWVVNRRSHVVHSSVAVFGQLLNGNRSEDDHRVIDGRDYNTQRSVCNVVRLTIGTEVHFNAAFTKPFLVQCMERTNGLAVLDDRHAEMVCIGAVERNVRRSHDLAVRVHSDLGHVQDAFAVLGHIHGWLGLNQFHGRVFPVVGLGPFSTTALHIDADDELVSTGGHGCHGQNALHRSVGRDRGRRTVGADAPTAGCTNVPVSGYVEESVAVAKHPIHVHLQVLATVQL